MCRNCVHTTEVAHVSDVGSPTPFIKRGGAIPDAILASYEQACTGDISGYMDVGNWTFACD